mmetsp:Transcript_44495/g.128630  ORF Transcript_44495/g.128630 Transcript_44495/m.128630 type:complete len:269 (+) Transcript_44495:126-932(+)
MVSSLMVSASRVSSLPLPPRRLRQLSRRVLRLGRPSGGLPKYSREQVMHMQEHQFRHTKKNIATGASRTRPRYSQFAQRIEALAMASTRPRVHVTCPAILRWDSQRVLSLYQLIQTSSYKPQQQRPQSGTKEMKSIKAKRTAGSLQVSGGGSSLSLHSKICRSSSTCKSAHLARSKHAAFRVNANSRWESSTHFVSHSSQHGVPGEAPGHSFGHRSSRHTRSSSFAITTGEWQFTKQRAEAPTHGMESGMTSDFQQCRFSHSSSRHSS